MKPNSNPSSSRFFLFYGTVLLSLASLLSCPSRAFAQSGLLLEPTEPFYVYCDSNGGGTGECDRLDNNEALSCELSSHDFIQCRSKQGYLANCLYFSVGQFVCRDSTDVHLNSRGDCEDSLQTSSGCRQPLRDKFTNSLTPLQKPSGGSATPPLLKHNQNLLDDTLPGTLQCDLYGDYCVTP
jgi:hypothetical protein